MTDTVALISAHLVKLIQFRGVLSMNIKRIFALALACIITSSTIAYADVPDGNNKTVNETVAPGIDSIDSFSDYGPAEEPAEAPVLDDYDEPETTDASDKPVADDVTDDYAADIPDDYIADDFDVESVSTEELVGATSYRSIYEPCFSKVRQMNQQKFDVGEPRNYERYAYTLLDLNYDGTKELIVNASWGKYAHTYYIYTVKSGSTASLIGKVGNTSFDPIMTNGSRIAFLEVIRRERLFHSSPFNGTYDYDDLKRLYEGSYTYSSTLAALKDLTRKYFAANAVMSPEFINVSDLSLLNNAGNVTRFSDVIPNQTPHAKEVYWAAAKGITKGYTGTNLFGVEDTCTRGEAAMFLWRLAGKPAPKSVSKPPFSDVPKSHAFYNAILWAYQKGIAKGYSNGKFDVNGKCTRGQIATFIWRYKGSPKPKTSKNPFKDALTPAYKTAIIWAAEKGITKGFSDNTFRDKQYCTRGEIVTFLYRVK